MIDLYYWLHSNDTMAVLNVAHMFTHTFFGI